MTLVGTGARSLPRRILLRARGLRRSLCFKYFLTLFVAVVMFPLGVYLVERRRPPAANERSAAVSVAVRSLANPLVSAPVLGLVFAASRLELPGVVEDYLGIFAAALALGLWAKKVAEPALILAAGVAGIVIRGIAT